MLRSHPRWLGSWLPLLVMASGCVSANPEAPSSPTAESSQGATAPAAATGSASRSEPSPATPHRFSLPDHQQKCDRGDGAACNIVGIEYWKGPSGTPIDVERARKHLRRACALEDQGGCANLERLEGQGDHLKHLSLGALADACNARKEAPACFLLGSRYDNGEGVPKDEARATRLYEQACAAGSSRGCWNAGVCAAQGIGRAVDPRLALQRYDRACELGHAEACSTAGLWYYQGKSGAQTKDLGRAAARFTKACELGAADGCRNIGVMLRSGEGVSKDHAAALDSFRRGCLGGSGVACYGLAQMCEAGEGMDAPNQECITASSTLACHREVTESCLPAAVRHERGQGAAKSLDKALELYGLACKAGVAEGCTEANRVKADRASTQ